MNSMIRKLMLSLLVIHVRCQDVDSGHAYGAAVGEEVRVRADGDLDMRLEAVNASVDQVSGVHHDAVMQSSARMMQDMVILCSDYEIPKSDKNLYIGKHFLGEDLRCQSNKQIAA